MKDIPLSGPEQMESMIPAEIGLIFFQKLFFIEKGPKGMDPELRKEKRLEKEAPVWEKFWAWTKTLNPLGGSKLEKAVNYALNHKETLCNYMLDGRCEMSNNAAERRAKSYAIGRKNVTVQITSLLRADGHENRFAMGRLPVAVTFFHGQRSKCAYLSELLRKTPCSIHQSLVQKQSRLFTA